MISKMSKKIKIALLVLVTLSSVLFFLATAPTKQASAAPGVGSAAKEVIHPANLFDDGKARYFTHRTADGVTIRYFVIKSSDGVIRAAFDTCDVCWREGKGYVQKEDFMVCKNCGRRFKSTRINDVTGGCNPAALARKIENGKVVISTRDLAEGRMYFTGGNR